MERPSIQTPLCDGLARGRLSIAEICGLEQEELDALCELGSEKLELGLVNEALSVFAGLIALYPFNGKFWRCYAVALHQAGHLREAEHACKSALLLEPDSVSAQQHLNKLSPHLPPQTPPESKEQARPESTGFSLVDGQPLPLNPSTFPAPVPAEDTSLAEATVVAPRPPASEEVTEVNVQAVPTRREITQTAIIRRRPTPTRLSTFEGTQTAIVRRNRGHRVVDAATEESPQTFFDGSSEENSDG